MKSLAINVLAFGGLVMQGFGLYTVCGIGIACLVVGTELFVLGLIGAVRAG